MDYEPKVGDWIRYESEYGLKIGEVKYVRKAEKPEDHDTGPCHRVDLFYTEDDRVAKSEILEVRCAEKKGEVL